MPNIFITYKAYIQSNINSERRLS